MQYTKTQLLIQRQQFLYPLGTTKLTLGQPMPMDRFAKPLLVSKFYKATLSDMPDE